MSNAKARAYLRASAFATAAALLAGTLAAQEEPIVIGGKKQERRTVAFDRPSASLGLSASYNVSTSKSPNSEETRTEQTIYQEVLNIATRGFVLSPNFIDMNLAGQFGFEQTSIDTNVPGLEDANGDGSEETYEYDLSANILRLSSAPLRVFARRNEEIITQPFGLSYDSTVDTYGAEWQIKHKTLPTSLRYQHVSVEQTTLGRVLDFASTEDILGWNTTWRPSSNQYLTWNYTFSTLQSEGGIEEDEQRHDASLAHTVTFGRNTRNRLESGLEYYSETDDDFSYDRSRWYERLTLRHSETFETRYAYDFLQFNYGETETTTHRGIATFTHWLYQSLVTTGSFTYGLSDSDGAQTTEWIGILTFDYTKKVPLGTLYSTLSTSYSQVSSEASASDIIVLDQPVTFNGYQPLVISQQNIVPESIRLTQRVPGGEEVFVPGIDYTVTPVPGGVELRRVGTNVPAGEPVLLDYTVAPQSSNDTNTSILALSTRYTFEETFLRRLSPYARYLVQQQNVTSDGPDGPLPNDVTSYIFGADYQIWYLQLKAEHQIVDSTLLPFELTRFRADWSQDLGPNLRGAAGAEYVFTTYTDQDTETEALSITAAVDYRLTRYLSAMARTSWIHQTDTLSGVTEGWDNEVGFRWSYRQTSVYSTVRQTNLTTEDLETNNLLLQVGLERRF